jgi:hypothetical protein
VIALGAGVAWMAMPTGTKTQVANCGSPNCLKEDPPTIIGDQPVHVAGCNGGVGCLKEDPPSAVEGQPVQVAGCGASQCLKEDAPAAIEDRPTHVAGCGTGNCDRDDDHVIDTGRVHVASCNGSGCYQDDDGTSFPDWTPGALPIVKVGFHVNY